MIGFIEYKCFLGMLQIYKSSFLDSFSLTMAILFLEAVLCHMSLTAALGFQFLISFTFKHDFLVRSTIHIVTFVTKSLNLVNFFETVDLEGC